MTLQDLWVNLKYRYDNTGIRNARRDMGEFEQEVDETSDSVERLDGLLTTLGVATAAGIYKGVNAYRTFSETLVELSGKAGLTINQFKELTTAADQIARSTGAADRSIRETYQQVFSLGANKEQAERLAFMGGVLESMGLARGSTAASSAMSLQTYGFGRASDILQMMHATSQVGPGEVPEYFSQVRALGSAAAGLFNTPDLLAMMTIGGRGKSLAEAQTQIKALISSILKDPSKDSLALYQQQTQGGEWGDLRTMIRDEGAESFFKHMAENFDDDQLFTLFGREEAVYILKALAANQGDFAKNRDFIRGAPGRDSIGEAGRDSWSEFSQIWKKFAETFGQFMREFGKPFATMMKPLLLAFTSLLEGLLILNNALNGFLMWILSSAASFFFLPKAIAALTVAISALRRLPAFGGAVGGIGGVGGKSNKDDWMMKEKKPSIASAAGAGAAVGSLWGFLGREASVNFKWMWGKVKDFIMNPVNKAVDDLRHEKKSSIDYFTRSQVKALIVIAAALMTRGLLPLIIAGGIGLGYLFSIILGTANQLFGTPESDEQLRRLRGRDAQQDHFRGEGYRGEEPAPGVSDIAAARTALAVAEMNLLFDVAYDRIIAMVPSYIRVFLELTQKFWEGYIRLASKAWGGVFSFFRDLYSDPRATISKFKDDFLGLSANTASWGLRNFLDSTGGIPTEAEILKQLQDLSSDTQFAQPTIKLTREQAKAFGIQGDYSSALNAPNVANIQLPTPPDRLDPSNMPQPIFNFSMGDINIQGEHADDRFELARKMREEAEKALKNSADYIIQEMDWASP